MQSLQSFLLNRQVLIERNLSKHDFFAKKPTQGYNFPSIIVIEISYPKPSQQ